MLDYTNVIKEKKSYSGLQMNEIGPVMKLIIRGKKREFLSAIGKSLNLLLPSEANTSSRSEKLTALWLSPDEWLIYSNEILNKEGLRNLKEFVNHKILDCIGDLYTCVYRMIASVKCSQGGHYLTNQLLRKVFENKENISIVEIQERNLPHTAIKRNLLRSIA